MNIAQKTTIGLVKLYKKCVSPLFPKKCKFVPTCSEYAIEAIKEFGTMKGIFLGMARICRCNHFSKGGYDPVPLNIVGEYKWLL